MLKISHSRFISSMPCPDPCSNRGSKCSLGTRDLSIAPRCPVDRCGEPSVMDVCYRAKETAVSSRGDRSVPWRRQELSHPTVFPSSTLTHSSHSAPRCRTIYQIMRCPLPRVDVRTHKYTDRLSWLTGLARSRCETADLSFYQAYM